MAVTLCAWLGPESCGVTTYALTITGVWAAARQDSGQERQLLCRPGPTSPSFGIEAIFARSTWWTRRRGWINESLKTCIPRGNSESRRTGHLPTKAETASVHRNRSTEVEGSGKDFRSRELRWRIGIITIWLAVPQMVVPPTVAWESPARSGSACAPRSLGYRHRQRGYIC